MSDREKEDRVLQDSVYFYRYILPEWFDRHQKEMRELIEKVRQDDKSELEIQSHFKKMKDHRKKSK